jgi:hypothetical protein
MRIGELARQSGIAVPTIKYYLRVGLVTARNQAEYGPAHLRRLRVADALVGVGNMTVTGARTVLAAVDDVRVSPAGLLAAVEAGSMARHPRGLHGRNEAAVRAVAETVNRRPWGPRPAGSQRDRLTEVCAVAQLLDVPELAAALDCYAATAEEAAGCDLAVLLAHTARRRLEQDPVNRELREAVVVVAVLGGVVQSAMDRLARHDMLARYLAGESMDPR